jgi:hypothetical protein
MKKLMNVIALILIQYTMGNAQIVEFKNTALFKEIINNQLGIDQNKDGKLQVEEADAVLYFNIYIDYSDIHDLKCFKNLEKISIQGNNKDSIDLSIFPNLKNIDIDCKEIKYLNISSNSKLEDISLRSFNQDFDGSMFHELKYLSFSFSNIKLVNLNKNSNLMMFRSEFDTIQTFILPLENHISDFYINSQIHTKVNFEAFSNLKYVLIGTSFTDEELKKLNHTLEFNFIGNIDRMKNLIKFTSLKRVAILNDSVNTLDFSTNKLLTRISIEGKNIRTVNISNNLFIKELEISKTKISELNLSKFRYLRKLELVGNKISILDLSNNFCINEIKIDSTEIKQIILPFNVSKSIIIGSTDGIYISNASMHKSLNQIVKIKDKQLFKALLSNSVDINGNGKIEKFEAIKCLKLQLANKEIKNITGLEEFINLTDLDISYNQIQKLSIDKIKFLKRLNCSHNLLKELFVNNMTEMSFLKANHNLIDSASLNTDEMYTSMNDSINFSNNHLTSFELNWAFTNIDLSHNHISTVTGIGPGALDVSYNQLTDIDLSMPNLFFVNWLSCTNNPIQKIKLNDRTDYLKCDKRLIKTIKKYNLNAVIEY